MSGLPTRTLYVHFSKMYQGQIQVVFDGLGTNPISRRDPHVFFVRNKSKLSKGVRKCFGIQINDKKNPEEGGGGPVPSAVSASFFLLKPL